MDRRYPRGLPPLLPLAPSFFPSARSNFGQGAGPNECGPAFPCKDGGDEDPQAIHKDQMHREEEGILKSQRRRTCQHIGCKSHPTAVQLKKRDAKLKDVAVRTSMID